jgi:hypothetical protein
MCELACTDVFRARLCSCFMVSWCLAQSVILAKFVLASTAALQQGIVL